LSSCNHSFAPVLRPFIMAARRTAAASTADKQYNKLRESAVATAPRHDGNRRQPNARATRPYTKLDCTGLQHELQDLVSKSELETDGQSDTEDPVSQKVFDAETVSTAVPSSAEQSPDLACLPSDADAWPSLREAESGWDFCSDQSDNEDLWEALPEPALALEGLESTSDSNEPSCVPSLAADTNWWLVAGVDPTRSPKLTAGSLKHAEDSAAKPTFADLMKDGEKVQFSPPCGPAKPPVRVESMQRRTLTFAPADDRVALDEHVQEGRKGRRSSRRTKRREIEDDDE